MTGRTGGAIGRDPRAIALMLAATLTMMSNATISPGLPALAASFPDEPRADYLARLLITAPALVVAVTAPFAGLAADRFGRRRLLIGGVVLFIVAGTAGIVLPDLPAILASRLVLGLAVALVMTTQAALLGDWFAGDDRARVMGWQVAAMNFGGFVFIGLAGWLAAVSPRLPFLIYALPLAYLPFLLRGTAERARSVAPRTAGGGGGGKLWAAGVAAMALLAGATLVLFYLMPTQAPFHLDGLGFGASSAGVVLSVLTLAGGCSALAYGRVRRRLGPGGTPAAGYAVMAAGFWTFHGAETLPLMTAGATLIGLGLAQVMPTFLAVVLDLAPPARRGLASGVVTTSIFLGQFLSPVAAEPVIAAYGTAGGFAASAAVLATLSPLVFLALQPNLFRRRAAACG